MSKIFKTLNDPEVSQLLQNGAVGVLPSDTQYGLMTLATNEESIKRLYAYKKRENKPGTLVAANLQQLVDLGLKARYLKAVEQYWPNPLSIVIPCGPELAYLHRGLHSLAVRIPVDKPLRKLLEKTGVLQTTSANPVGSPVAGTIQQARGYFGDDVDFYVDGGDLSGREPSTVIRVVDDAIEILRPGALVIDESGRIKS